MTCTTFASATAAGRLRGTGARAPSIQVAAPRSPALSTQTRRPERATSRSSTTTSDGAAAARGSGGSAVQTFAAES